MTNTERSLQSQDMGIITSHWRVQVGIPHRAALQVLELLMYPDYPLHITACLLSVDGNTIDPLPFPYSMMGIEPDYSQWMSILPTAHFPLFLQHDGYSQTALSGGQYY